MLQAVSADAWPTAPAASPHGAAKAPAPGWWAPGLTLAERLRLTGDPAHPADGERLERARRRLERWENSHGLGEGGRFAELLAERGLDAERLRALLAEEPAHLAGRADATTGRPAWAGTVEAVLEAMPAGERVPDPPREGTPDSHGEKASDRHEETPGRHGRGGSEPEGDATWQAGFLEIVAPFVRFAVDRFATAVRADGLDGLADLAGIGHQLATQLGGHLAELAARTLVLELNVLRVTGRLRGDTPQRRFRSFVEHFATKDGLTGLLSEYVVLARLLAQACDQAAETYHELLVRLAADRAELVTSVFGGEDPGRLVEVKMGGGVGDAHQGGRSVGLLRFAGGGRLVYKPRPLSVHAHVNDVIHWLDDRLPGYDLRSLTVVDSGGYGWVEFVEYDPDAGPHGIRRFYRRQGALMALLYALDGVDFHYENLIAAGEQPILVDLEAVFHPEVPRPSGVDWLDEDPAGAVLAESVSRIGLLPSVLWSEDGGALDMGGVGADAGQTMPFKVVNWDGPGTDEMRLVREQAVFPGSQNRLSADGGTVNPAHFAGELIAGFRAGYEAIASGHDGLVGDGGLLERFAGDEIRVVMRATRIYGMLLMESTHPDVLRDALDRDRVFDLLWVLAENDPVRRPLVPLENEELWAGDVPMFTTRPTTRDVWNGRGVRLPGVLDRESLAHVTGKIRAMGETDLARQEWIIRASMATRPDQASVSAALDPAPVSDGHDPMPAAAVLDPAPVSDGHDPMPPAAAPGPAPFSAGPGGAPGHADRDRGPGEPAPLDRERVLAAVRRIADQLADLALADGSRVNWLGMDLVQETRWVVSPLRMDLYSGVPGVALFLAQAAALTGEDRYADLARRSLAPLPRIVDALAPTPAGVPVPCGPFNGHVGLAYALTHLARELDDPGLRDAVEPLVASMVESIPGDGTLDVVGGVAGAVGALLAVHEATGSALARRAVQACADRLVETAGPQPRGVAWQVAVAAVQPLTGFSHGAGGIGWALARAAAASDDSAARARYAETARAAFDYERGRFDTRVGNWPDYRDTPETSSGDDGTPSHMQGWCHGAPGIGLARADLLLRGVADDHPLLARDLAGDLDLALRSFLAGPPSQIGHSLCHGEVGNLELLTTAIAAGRTDLTGERDRRLGVVLDQLDAGPRCGTPAGVPTPGLMTGLAGIGHGLLRHAFPDRVSPVLLLAPPAD
ncbi:type 2 lanthipeptide synthetase LanM family protein [Streptosporangium sp. NPDC048865]|uniref:type 2 lanthipeptide synthetase LanM family protein n=1 Tax=Streptosporangium sp. NPDC048865 TaxID=3155766 RepID=UPI0034358796